ncbi:MAG: sulfite exporter TauE/SafE family protein, partial [Candidatus Peregrinibacteria bacterium]
MKQKIRIAGMHCVSCEVLLTQEFKKLPGVTACHASHRKGSAVIECDGEMPMDEIKKIVQQHNYRVLEKGETAEAPAKKNTVEDYLEMFLIGICLLAIIFFINELGLTQYLPDFSKKAGIGIAFLIGAVASLSTCLALIGGIVMSFGVMVKTDGNGQSPFAARAKPHFFFHIGRILSFILLGGLLGALGSKISVSLSFTGILTILVSVVMAYIALQILNIVPSITKMGFHLPKFLSSGIHSLQEGKHHLAPLLIGALTFFLPCGFTQSAQLSS